MKTFGSRYIIAVFLLKREEPKSKEFQILPTQAQEYVKLHTVRDFLGESILLMYSRLLKERLPGQHARVLARLRCIVSPLGHESEIVNPVQPTRSSDQLQRTLTCTANGSFPPRVSVCNEAGSSLKPER